MLCRAPSRAALRGGARAASSLTTVDGRFSAVLWGSLRYPMEKMRKHPFVVSVRDGSIDEDTMRWYLEQDFLYLVHYGRAFKILSARVPVENAARHLTALPTSPATQVRPLRFLTLLWRRFRLPLPATPGPCRCGTECDPMGDHCAACSSESLFIAALVHPPQPSSSPYTPTRP